MINNRSLPLFFEQLWAHRWVVEEIDNALTMEAAKSLLWSAGVSDFLGKDLISLGSSAAGLAIVLHLTLFRTSFPTEDHLHDLLILYVVSVSAVFAAYLSSTDYSVTQSLVRVCWIAGAFNTGLVLSIGVYRLFFHRLRHFPGPIGSKVSRFYDAYLAGRNVQYNVEIENKPCSPRLGRGRR